MPPLTTSMGMRASATINAFWLDVQEAFESQDKSNVFDLIESMSLVNQGILKKTPNRAPLLSIYGTADDHRPKMITWLKTQLSMED